MDESTGSFSLKKFLFGSIKRKLILSFIIAGLIPITILGLLSITLLKDSLNKEISDGILRLAEAKEGQVYAYFDSLETRAADFSSDGIIINSIAKINKGESFSQLSDALNDYLNVNKKSLDPTIRGIFVIDPKGRIIASTNPEEMGKDESKDDYFLNGKKGAFVSELEVHEHFNLTNTFIATAPLTDKDTEELLGVIAVVFDVDKLYDIISGQFQLDKGAISGRAGLTENLEVYMVNGENIMFVHTHKLGADEQNKHFTGMSVNTLPVQKCLERKQDIIEIYDNYRGEKVLGASMCFPKQRLTLLAEIRTAEAFALVYKLQSLLYVMTAFFVLVTVSVSLIVSETISTPIRKLRKTTEEMEKGNFNASVDIRSGDEMQQLGTAFNRAAEALGRLEEEHKQLDRAKTEFLSITGHELRSPMTSMKAQLQMILKGYFGKLNAKQRESLDIVLRNTERLDSVLLDFLEISRIEAARLKFNFVKTNLATHINRLVKEMGGFLPEKNIRIVTKIGKLPVVEADPDRVMQVLRNLLNNAKKFSNNNSKIFVNAELTGNLIRISVKDTGTGIAPENQRRMFEPFSQEEHAMARKYGGTGLGLAICRGIVESQNGRIWMESQLGKGTEFYFTVPLKPVKEIKPIKLLFSDKKNIETQLKRVFIEYLGPIGESEFERMNQTEVSYEGALSYLSELKRKGILDERNVSQAENRVKSVFNVELQESGFSRLIKKNLREEEYETMTALMLKIANRLYGSAAIQKANSVEGLKVNNKCKIIKIGRNKRDTFIILQEIYANLLGDLGRFITEKELKKALEKGKTNGKNE